MQDQETTLLSQLFIETKLCTNDISYKITEGKYSKLSGQTSKFFMTVLHPSQFPSDPKGKLKIMSKQ